MRILFVGCVESSYLQLKLLIEHKKNIVGVITKEKSNFNADFCDISALCESIPFVYSDNINDAKTVDFIIACQPDIIYCFGWSQLIKSKVLSIPRFGVIGNHPAELPHNRGRHPIIWALVLGLNHTASTFFRMNEGADTGDIISQEIIPIEYTDYARDLYDRITESECRQIIKFTDKLEKGNIQYLKQKPNDGNSWRKRSASDGNIDWRMSKCAIYNLVRALSEPYPGASFEYNEKRIRVWRCEEEESSEYKNIEPGKILSVESSNNYRIKAYDGIIHVTDSDEFDGKAGEYL
jgi:Methionyl-tRNA formyltransferase